MVLDLFKVCDLYGKTFQFTVFKKELYKTEFGGLLSILSILSIMCSIIYFGKDFFYRQNPNYIYQASTLPSYPIVNIDNSNFYLSLSIQDFNANILNLSEYIDIQVYHGVFLNNTSSEDHGNFSNLKTYFKYFPINFLLKLIFYLQNSLINEVI